MSRIHRSQPQVVSRDQLVAVALSDQHHNGRLTTRDLTTLLRRHAAQGGRIQSLAVTRLTVGKLHGLAGRARYKRRSSQLLLSVLPAHDNRDIITLVAVVQRGATHHDMQEYKQLVASVKPSATHR